MSKSQQLKDNYNHLFFIDFLKALAILSVVSFHGIFVPGSSYEEQAFFLETWFAPLRFCVPIFLTISFFLFERSFITNPHQSKWLFLKKRYQRLILPMVFWFTLSGILKLVKGNSLLEISKEIIRGEIFTGAYYLLIVLQLILLFILIRKKFGEEKLIINVLIQSIIIIIIYAYLLNPNLSDTVEFLRLLDRPLIIYWLIYPAWGIYLAHNLSDLKKLSRKSSLIIKLLLIIVLCLLFKQDYSNLYKITQSAIEPFDYLTISSMFSVPIIFYCCVNLQEKHLPIWLRKTVILLSRYSLGIYCINGLLRIVFLSIGSDFFQGQTFTLETILIYKFLGWIFLASISLILSIFLERLGLKYFVC